MDDFTVGPSSLPPGAEPICDEEGWVYLDRPDLASDDRAFRTRYLGKTLTHLTHDHADLKGITWSSLCFLPKGIQWLNLSGCLNTRMEVTLPDTITHLWLRKVDLDYHSFLQLPATLRLLDVSETLIPDNTPFDHLPNLRTLWLDKTPLTGHHFGTLTTQLQRLSLRGCEELTTLNYLPPSLVWLDLRGSDLVSYQVSFLELPNLKLLLLDTTGIQNWSTLPPTVSALGCYGDTQQSRPNVERWDNGAPGSNWELSTLVKHYDKGPQPSLEPDEKVTDWFIEQLHDDCQELKVAHCRIKWGAFIRWPPGIIRLEAPRNLLDGGIANLPRGLVCLTLNQCHRVTEEGWKQLPPTLIELKIESERVDPSLLKHLPKTLEILELNLQEKVPDEALNNVPPGLQIK